MLSPELPLPQKDQDDQPLHTESQVASPGASVGRLHGTSIEHRRPAVEWWKEEVSALALVSVRLLREGQVQRTKEGTIALAGSADALSRDLRRRISRHQARVRAVSVHRILLSVDH